MQKSLTQYGQEVYLNKNNPGVLADLHIELGMQYASMTDEYKDLKLEKAVFWNMKYAGEIKLSDKAVEMQWLQTDSGKKELKIKYALDGIEKLIGAIKTSSVVSAMEAKNQF